MFMINDHGHIFYPNSSCIYLIKKSIYCSLVNWTQFQSNLSASKLTKGTIHDNQPPIKDPNHSWMNQFTCAQLLPPTIKLLIFDTTGSLALAPAPTLATGYRITDTILQIDYFGHKIKATIRLIFITWNKARMAGGVLVLWQLNDCLVIYFSLLGWLSKHQDSSEFWTLINFPACSTLGQSQRTLTEWLIERLLESRSPPWPTPYLA